MCSWNEFGCSVWHLLCAQVCSSSNIHVHTKLGFLAFAGISPPPFRMIIVSRNCSRTILVKWLFHPRKVLLLRPFCRYLRFSQLRLIFSRAKLLSKLPVQCLGQESNLPRTIQSFQFGEHINTSKSTYECELITRQTRSCRPDWKL